jgi:hypothetical protein
MERIPRAAYARELRKRSKTLLGASRSSRIGNGGRNGWAIYPLPHTRGSSIFKGLLHEKKVSCILLTSDASLVGEKNIDGMI